VTVDENEAFVILGIERAKEPVEKTSPDGVVES
jgi:hypothetical protein